MYLLTGKYEPSRNLVSGPTEFFSKPCFAVRADMAAKSATQLQPYFGRIDYRNFLERIRRVGKKEPLDNQEHMPSYINIFPR